MAASLKKPAIFPGAGAGWKLKAQHIWSICEHFYLRPNEEIGDKGNFYEPASRYIQNSLFPFAPVIGDSPVALTV